MAFRSHTLAESGLLGSRIGRRFAAEKAESVELPLEEVFCSQTPDGRVIDVDRGNLETRQRVGRVDQGDPQANQFLRNPGEDESGNDPVGLPGSNLGNEAEMGGRVA